jgi:glycosyltransferase involved in cell wall biosynthesis
LDATSKTEFQNASFVMPVRNEEQYLASAVESVMQQKAPGNTELILAIAPSTDKTMQLAKELVEKYKNLRLIENPAGDTATGLNLAISQAQCEVIVRVDAHSQLSPDYLASALTILSETGAANVGGRMRAEGDSPFQKAVAYGYNNRIGLGGGSFHVGGKAGEVESVYLGVFQKSWLEKVQGFDPKWVRGQDWELSQRIKASGGLVWFDPRLEVTYYPRSSWRALAKQFYQTGVWRGALTRKNPVGSSIRYWLPPMFLVAAVFGFPLGLYLLLVASVAATAKDLDSQVRLRLLLVLPTMHFSWGLGFWVGLIRRQSSAGW